MARRYPTLELSGAPPALELALTALFDHGCLGVEETSSDRLHAYFPDGTDAAMLIRDLARLVPGVQSRELPPLAERDWLAEWKAGLRGFPLGERFYVSPTWMRPPATRRSVLRLDPEQAFGTGTHETTRLAARLLERSVCRGESVIDLGAGTGLLGMIAARLGAREVRAIELDPDAAACARRNVARNGLDARVRVERAGAEDYDALRADVVVANITAPVLARALDRIDARVLILSGLLTDELDGFVEGLPDRFVLRETHAEGEWSALLLNGRAGR